MFGSATYARYVITTLENLAKKGPAIGYTRQHGDPRVNIQGRKGKARAYQVRQVLKAVERWKLEHGSER
jgi:hypothetical protein